MSKRNVKMTVLNHHVSSSIGIITSLPASEPSFASTYTVVPVLVTNPTNTVHTVLYV